MREDARPDARTVAPDPHERGPAAMTPPAPPTYDERLTAPRTWWLIAVAVGFSMALIVMPYGALAALGGFAAGTLVTCLWVSAQGSSRIRVTSGLLVADDARIPLGALGEVHVLEGEEARAWRTYKADLRAHMMMRGFVTGAVRIENTDPADPTPYVYLSTRTPQALADALAAARTR
ncbi:membrane protein [Streptomyces subrutilus]|uniref:Membrane protein n=2 Tax=Streptomyces subrutilus TaxID=36818 RepID=A0A918QSR8_9ACTN|nr:membrane protein [Streptomyces subrutilus]